MKNRQMTINRDISQLVQLMLEHEIVPTNQRLDVARVLLTEFQHLSADQVLLKAKQNGSAISKATVYNTLNLFSERGLIRQVVIDNSKVFFDSNVDEHHHIYNEDTGELIDIMDSDIAVSEMPKLPKGTVTTGVDIIIRVKNK